MSAYIINNISNSYRIQNLWHSIAMIKEVMHCDLVEHLFSSWTWHLNQRSLDDSGSNHCLIMLIWSMVRFPHRGRVGHFVEGDRAPASRNSAKTRHGRLETDRPLTIWSTDGWVSKVMSMPLPLLPIHQATPYQASRRSLWNWWRG